MLSSSNQDRGRPPEVLLQNLIQFDKTNASGNEVKSISYVNNLLTGAVYEAYFFKKDIRIDP
jgi:hypothetical protein